ncbi:hypothetical protein EV421DRAFT_2040887 [Armillaria borealis]|uniref:Uncharacterized protein n=1 Tax=Armillaria borealis TaxID=47425 RepID=A0AA39IX31_9AGAR|nr:hypothetical protein EV421DRAFT_2040887 [Armillaria borealis]
MLPGANPIQALGYEEYVMLYMLAIVGPVYVSMEEGVVRNGMMEVVVPARTVNWGRKPEGMCLWTGDARGVGVPQVMVLLDVLGILVMSLGLV